jgi:ABC-2 type transport system permease protein
LIYNSIPFIGIGLISASFIIAFKVGDITTFFISLIAIFFSGIFFPISSLPHFLHFFADINPLKVGLETAKILINDNFVFVDLLPYFMMTLIETILFLPIGIFLLHYGFRLAKKNGNLSFY